MRIARIAGLAVAALMFGAAGFLVVESGIYPAQGQPAAASPARLLQFPKYGEQKVVYQVTGNGGWFQRDYHQILAVAQNHVNAVEPGKLDLRIVMQGDGVGLVSTRNVPPAVAERISKLKTQGVKFMICRNTLVSRGLDPDKDLHDVAASDIVSAGVAEVASLETKGFVYIKP